MDGMLSQEEIDALTGDSPADTAGADGDRKSTRLNSSH